MEFVYFLTLYIFSEVFEFLTQKGDSFKELFSSLLNIYSRGILRFLLRNPSFYIVLFAILYFDNYSFLALLLFTCKFLDLVLKIVVCDKILYNKPLGNFAALFANDMKITSGMKIGIILIYVVLFCISFSPYA